MVCAACERRKEETGEKNQNNNKYHKNVCWTGHSRVSIFENVWFWRRDILSSWFSTVWGGESYSCFNHYHLHFTPRMTYLQTEFIVDCKYKKHQCYYLSVFLYDFCVLYVEAFSVKDKECITSKGFLFPIVKWVTETKQRLKFRGLT